MISCNNKLYLILITDHEYKITMIEHDNIEQKERPKSTEYQQPVPLSTISNIEYSINPKPGKLYIIIDELSTVHRLILIIYDLNKQIKEKTFILNQNDKIESKYCE